MADVKNSLIEYPFAFANYFIPEFVERMRRNREVIEKPSPRQSINMGRILLPSYMRDGCLKFESLLNAAVITSQVDNQKIAEKVALDILTHAADEEEDPQEDLEGDQLLSLLSKKTQEVYVTPMAKGLEPNIVNDHPDAEGPEQFIKFKNKPDIGVGPGEDRILKYGTKAMKEERDERMRRLLAHLLKERLLKLGRELERKDDWSRVASVRPYQPGEDTEAIDEDRSIENIIDLGRRVDEIRPDDFMMLKRKKKNRNIVYIQDISNTMFYDYEGINSVNYSILSLVPLMWGLRADNWGLILYESNSHVIKELSDEMDMEPVLEQLIDMVTMTTTQMEFRFRGTVDGSTWGGTVPGKSIRWAYDQLTEASERSDRICFYFSDFVLTDPGKETMETKQNYEMIEDMVNDGVRVFAGISPLAHKDIFRPYTASAINRLRKLGVMMADTYVPSEFLEKAHAWLDEI